MLNFAKYVFYFSCNIVLNAVLFMAFGAIVAFLFLATKPIGETGVRESSPVLVEFLNSSEKSKIFSARELNEGVYGLILRCAREHSRASGGAVSMPISPIILVGNSLEVCVPFSPKNISADLKLGAYAQLSFDGKSASMVSARIGEARLPNFVANKIFKSIYEAYAEIKPLQKYFYILSKSKVEILSDGKIEIKK